MANGRPSTGRPPFDYVAHGLQCIAKEQGADKIGALVSPHSTLEELYLTQKMLRGMGIGNIDSRLRQADFSGDALEQGAPWLGVGIDEVAKQNAMILLVGSNIRKEQPPLATRVRAAVRKGAQLSVIGVYDEDMLCKVAAKTITAPAALPSVLLRCSKQLQRAKGAAVPAHLADAVAAAVVDAQSQQMAGSLISGETALILLGDAIQQHPQYAAMRQIAQALADIAGASWQFRLLQPIRLVVTSLARYRTRGRWVLRQDWSECGTDAGCAVEGVPVAQHGYRIRL